MVCTSVSAVSGQNPRHVMKRLQWLRPICEIGDEHFKGADRVLEILQPWTEKHWMHRLEVWDCESWARQVA
jgi:hypothetical protein